MNSVSAGVVVPIDVFVIVKLPGFTVFLYAYPFGSIFNNLAWLEPVFKSLVIDTVPSSVNTLFVVVPFDDFLITPFVTVTSVITLFSTVAPMTLLLSVFLSPLITILYAVVFG